MVTGPFFSSCFPMTFGDSGRRVLDSGPFILVHSVSGPWDTFHLPDLTDPCSAGKNTGNIPLLGSFYLIIDKSIWMFGVFSVEQGERPYFGFTKEKLKKKKVLWNERTLKMFGPLQSFFRLVSFPCICFSGIVAWNSVFSYFFFFSFWICQIVHFFSACSYLEALSALFWLAFGALLVKLASQLGIPIAVSTHVPVSILLCRLGHLYYLQLGISGDAGWAAHC